MTQGGIPSVQIGETIDGKYEIVRLLGEGGMGAVYEGRNARIGRTVAIKVLHAGVAHDKTVQQRFELEAQAAARIGSDHIIDVLDLGELPGGDRYMVMEFLDGEALDDRLVDAAPPEQIFPIMIQLLEGLGAAHEAGIVHRDLKPDNVYLVKEKKKQTDYVKILDFGISKFKQADGQNANLTHTGAMLGTPYYMSPEQVQGETDIDGRTDIYSAGVILFRALTGRVPFLAESVNKLMFKIALEEAPSLEELIGVVDSGVSAIVRKSMARDRQERYQTAEEFSEALRIWLDTRTGQATVALPAMDPTAQAGPGMHAGPTPAPMAGGGYQTGGSYQTGGGADASQNVVAYQTGGGADASQNVVAYQTGGGADASQNVGAYQTGSGAAPGMTASPSTQDIRQATQSGGDGSRLVAAIVGVVALLAIGGGVFLVTRSGDGGESPAAETAAAAGEGESTEEPSEEPTEETSEPAEEGVGGAGATSEPADTASTAEPSAQPTTPVAVAPKSTPTPKATAPKPQPTTPPAGGGTKVGGRKIRTGLD